MPARVRAFAGLAGAAVEAWHMKTELGREPGPDAETVGVEVEDFIDKLGLSRRLHMSPRTVDAWMRRGLLPYYKLGRLVRFKWSEVEPLLTKCHVCRERIKAGF